jgi:hypothetical protein
MKANLQKELETFEAGKPVREIQNELAEPEKDSPAEKTANKPGERK